MKMKKGKNKETKMKFWRIPGGRKMMNSKKLGHLKYMWNLFKKRSTFNFRRMDTGGETYAKGNIKC